MYAPPSSVVNAKKVIEYYAELSSVSAKEYALDSLLVSLLIDLDEFCGYEHDLDLEKLLSSARQHIDCERGDLQSPTNCVRCNLNNAQAHLNSGQVVNETDGRELLLLISLSLVLILLPS